jgi:hypothetical protein
MTEMTNRRDNATFSGSHVEEDGVVRDEEDSKPSLVTRISAPRIESCQDQEVVPEEVSVGEIPFGWTRVKLEPDC